MALSVTINGIAYVCESGWQIKQQAGSIASTTIKVRLDALAVPHAFQSVQLTLNSVLIFSGLIKCEFEQIRFFHPYLCE